jgi:hypothetical protein
MKELVEEEKPKEEKKDIRTPLEKLAGMSKKNKDLEKLVKEFNLEVTL